MNKSKPEKAKSQAPDKETPPDGGWRETIESIAMAVILALLFRGFVAEAFVIPTGSMAPTLDGRHKDVWCPKCGQQYQVSGSDEQRDDGLTGFYVATATCPICRYTQTLDPLARPNQGSFSGDRIIVGKFCYDLAEPKRWDVIVFKYPGNAVQNYIKRLIGLPGEKVWVVGGNIYTCGLEESEDALRIARKPAAKLDSLLQLVDSTEHIASDLTQIGWPQRWNAWPQTDSAWKTSDNGRTFVSDGKQSTESWLRYRHLVPTNEEWKSIEVDHRLPASIGSRQGELISDAYGYNTPHYIYGNPVSFAQFPLPRSYRPAEIPQQPGPGEPPNHVDAGRRVMLGDNWDCFGQHWVDDLALECTADVTSKEGELSLMLVRGGVQHLCRINLASGLANLSFVGPNDQPIEFYGDDGQTTTQPSGQTAVKGPGRYRLRLSNCDHEMLLWVNGSVVAMQGPTTYKSEDLIAPSYSAEDPGDLAPAGIAARGAAVKLSGLKIYRDKYYIATTGSSNDYDRPLEARRIQDAFRDPSQWTTSGLFADENRRHVEFRIPEDQFLPMGDNSPQSYDGRYWGYFERDLLIGKALLIYWPHTWNRPVPFTPNFRRMGPIR